MSRRAMTSLVTIIMLATFALARPGQQNDKQSMPTKQDKSSSSTNNKSDRSMQSDSMQNTSGSMLDSSDRKFVMEAAHGGMMEVALGRTAVDKATNSDVKQFAQRMVDDHSKANAELQQLASQKGITLPESDMAMGDHSSTMSSSTAQSTDSQSSTNTASQHHADMGTSGDKMKGHAEMNKLGGLSGEAFDREYINMMVKDHEKDVKEFEKQSTKAKAPDLRAWAAKTLPTLREHLQQVRDIKARMKSSK
jgi:putative membrane protein